MACDASSRYQQLLQPIRDLSKVWNIAIAEELEKYIEEVSLLSFQADGVCKQLNFAEAALLIQGSAVVYSRKVELLYALVYQALNTCQQYSDQDEGASGTARKKLHTGLVAPIPEADELLTIGHLIKEGRNITMDDSALRRQEQRQLPHLRLPLFLLPRERTEGKTEFRIGNCFVHSSGAYLLHESDAHLLEEFTSNDVPNECSRTPLVPPPPKEVHDLDERLQKLLHGFQDTVVTWQSPHQHEDLSGAADPQDPAAAVEGSEPPIPLGDRQLGDPWELLDEHAQVGEDTPVEFGDCSKKLSKHLLAKADRLPKRGHFEPLSDADLWRPGHAMDGLPELLASAHPIESAFLAIARIIRHGNRTEVQKAGFSAAWLEFDDLFEVVRRRRESGLLRRGIGAAAPDVPCGEYLASYFDDEGAETPRIGASDLLQDNDNEFGESLEEQKQNQELQRRMEVAKIEGLIEDAESQHETTIRNRLHKLHGEEYSMNEKYPELYENVRRWQQQLKPVLKEFETRPEFNIDGYRGKVLCKMAAVEKDQPDVEESNSIPFSRLVHGQPPWEVCRRFLTCLILTNQGSTDIVQENEMNAVGGFSMKLLTDGKTHAESFQSGKVRRDADQSASNQPRAPKRAKLSHLFRSVETLRNSAQS